MSLLVSLAAILGCGDSSKGSGGAGGATAKLPCDVDAVLATTCRSCHGATPSFGAPMPLVTYDDLTAKAVTDPSRKVFELVGQRLHDDAHPMPQAPTPRLGAADLATMDAWIGGGAKPSTATCEGTGGAGGAPLTVSCTPDINVTPTQAFDMPADKTDDYVWYGFDVTAGDRKDVTAFVPHIDNTKIVHHVLLYQSDTAVGGTPVECSGSVQVTGKKLLYAWAPGGKAFELPAEAGMPLDPVTHYYVQIHYNNIQGLVGEKDASGFDLCTTTTARANEADMLAFGTLKFSIPPNASLTRDCSYQWPAGAGTVHAIAAFPHMHQLGTAIASTLNPATDATDLGKNDPWSFQNQPFFPIDATIKPGDTIETRCDWTNTGPTAVKFGETTEDEMCFSFTMYYPRSSAIKLWAQPAALSHCQ